MVLDASFPKDICGYLISCNQAREPTHDFCLFLPLIAPPILFKAWSASVVSSGTTTTNTSILLLLLLLLLPQLLLLLFCYYYIIPQMLLFCYYCYCSSSPLIQSMVGECGSASIKRSLAAAAHLRRPPIN